MTEPLVSFLTPVYNGGKYLSDCIESILAQNYENWEYYIINNCSNDNTLNVAEYYKKQDDRITVVNNQKFVNADENHNIAFRLISSKSKYCKVVSADDWITEDCISKMINFAKKYQNAGIIGAYQRSSTSIRWNQIPKTIQILPGREACRLALLKGMELFGAPTAFLYRSDLVKMKESFFPHTRPHADTSVCYEFMQYADYGIIHEVLSHERVHSEQGSSTLDELNAGTLAYLEDFLNYGPLYLNRIEFKNRKKEILDLYYRFLGRFIYKLKGKEFWRYHFIGLRELGIDIDLKKIIRFSIDEAIEESKNPRTTLEKVIVMIKNRFFYE